MLDRGVLFGRASTPAEETIERPNVIRLDHPDISRSHAEIVLDNWHVLVRDLGSTNGTTVTLPGQSAIRLRDGDMQLLEHGAIVAFADEISCVFEVTA